MSDSTCTPPKVWAWTKENGGKFAKINRPTAGPTHDKELPVGRRPLQLYSLGTPNGVKVTEYLAGDIYTIADISVWPWYGLLAKGLLWGRRIPPGTGAHAQRWTKTIAERLAVRRGRMVNRTFGDIASQVRERREAGDVDAKIQLRSAAVSG